MKRAPAERDCVVAERREPAEECVAGVGVQRWPDPVPTSVGEGRSVVGIFLVGLIL